MSSTNFTLLISKGTAAPLLNIMAWSEIMFADYTHLEYGLTKEGMFVVFTTGFTT